MGRLIWTTFRGKNVNISNCFSTQNGLVQVMTEFMVFILNVYSGNGYRSPGQPPRVGGRSCDAVKSSRFIVCNLIRKRSRNVLNWNFRGWMIFMIYWLHANCTICWADLYGKRFLGGYSMGMVILGKVQSSLKGNRTEGELLCIMGHNQSRLWLVIGNGTGARSRGSRGYGGGLVSSSCRCRCTQRLR